MLTMLQLLFGSLTMACTATPELVVALGLCRECEQVDDEILLACLTEDHAIERERVAQSDEAEARLSDNADMSRV